VDGEGVNDRYVLLAASTGDEIHRQDGLSTVQVFEWLIELARKNDAIFVAYGMSYDVNMILRDLDDQTLREILMVDSDDRDFVRWGDYEILYIPKKIFRLRYGSRSFVLYDVLSFFHGSFLDTLSAFLPKLRTPLLEEGKANRSKFTWKQRDWITRYNREECDSLVRLMEHVRTLFESEDLFLRKWHGPGAVADVVLGKKGIDIHEQYPTYKERSTPVELWTAFDCAFYGGRIESLNLGTVSNVYSYDVNSAYPNAARRLPQLTFAKHWKLSEEILGSRRQVSTTINPAVSLVSWNIDRSCRFGPFPFRDKRGRIYFPKQGVGWYWSPEVEAALEIFPKKVRVIRSWYQDAELKPSRLAQEIPRLYRRRNLLKKKQNPAEYSVKLALNSIYGKFAQRVGRAPFHCLPWAGMITSFTRAQLMRAAFNDPSAILAFATDALFTRSNLPLPLGNSLGTWKQERYEKLLLIMNGFYRLNSKTVKSATRGIPISNLNWDDALAQLNETGKFHVNQRYFVTHVSAMHQHKALGADRLKFIEREKTIDPLKSDKRFFKEGPKDWNKDCVDSRMPDFGMRMSMPSSIVMTPQNRERFEREALVYGEAVDID
jgi:hypothetical protein